MGDVNPPSPAHKPGDDHFPAEVMQALSAQAATVPAPQGGYRKPYEIVDSPDFTPQQAREIVVAAMRDFDPALGARAEKIFSQGFDDAVKKMGTAPDWKTVPKTNPPQRWMLEKINPGEKPDVQCSLPAHSLKSDMGPANPNDYSVIQYKYDGKINALVYLAHELGHSIADDNLRQGKHSHADNPKHMQETEAYFTQNILYDYLRNHPELEKQYPGIGKAAQEHFSTTMADNLAPLKNTPGAESLQGRPGAIVGATGLFELAKTDEAHRADIVASVMQDKGPRGFDDVLKHAGVKTPEDIRGFAQEAVAGASKGPKTPVVNIVIDSGDWDPKNTKVTKAEHDASIRKINESVEALRKQGIPTIWVQITEDTQAHPGQGGNRQLIKDLKMTELDIKPGDDVFQKRSMSSFATLDGIKNSETLEKYVVGQRKDGPTYKDAKWGRVSLDDLLKAKGAEHVTIMGAVAQYCVTDTAVDAARHGYGVTVITDAISGWHDKSTFDKIVMPDDPKISAKQVAGELQAIRANPEGRGIEKSDMAAVEATKKIKLLTLDRFVESAPAQKAVAAKPVTAQSKFLAPKETAPHVEEPAHGPVKGGALQEHGGTATGVASVAVDIAEGRYGRALEDTGLQLSLRPETYETAAKLLGEAGDAAKLLGEFSKKIPVAGAFITGGFVLYEVGADMYDGKFGKAGAAFVAGTAEAGGNVFGFGVGDLARETVREGVVLTAGENYAPNKSGLRDLGERIYEVGEKTIGGTEAKPNAEPPKRPPQGLKP